MQRRPDRRSHYEPRRGLDRQRPLTADLRCRGSSRLEQGPPACPAHAQRAPFPVGPPSSLADSADAAEDLRALKSDQPDKPDLHASVASGDLSRNRAERRFTISISVTDGYDHVIWGPAGAQVPARSEASWRRALSARLSLEVPCGACGQCCRQRHQPGRPARFGVRPHEVVGMLVRRGAAGPRSRPCRLPARGGRAVPGPSQPPCAARRRAGGRPQRQC
jgi:hypothetical protein